MRASDINIYNNFDFSTDFDNGIEIESLLNQNVHNDQFNCQRFGCGGRAVGRAVRGFIAVAADSLHPRLSA